MIGGLARKAVQLVADPTLRRWLVGRALGRYPGEPAYVPHRPPYLADLLPLAPEQPARRLPTLPDRRPEQAIEVPLPGTIVRLDPEAEGRLFDRTFADSEADDAVHRFAWLPLFADADPSWVGILWRAWEARFGDSPGGPAWHPYTAAERAINILAFARRHGLPAPGDATARTLARHAPAIADRLEYFGDHHSSNHLANDGRGLFLLGLGLGLPRATEMGRRILIAEAERILMPSGILREGSSHYHLLLARAFASAWLAARAHGRPEAPALETIVERMVAVIPRLALPGGFPLIGDISPDCPPEFLAGLVPGSATSSGWLAGLDPADRDAIVKLRDRVVPVDLGRLAADGWLRADVGPWSGLWHAAPHGFAAMPGHGHQDTGSFELHYEDVPLIRDPGRGAYGERGEAAHFRAAAAHNGITVDGRDPYPPNKPFYDPSFRRAVAGAPPRLRRDGDTVGLDHEGFARLAGVGRLSRVWRFAEKSFRLDDRLEGTGRRRLCRRLHTTLAVGREGEAIVLGQGRRRFRLVADRPARTQPTIQWSAYGRGEPATVIEFAEDATLPWSATLTVEAI